MLRAKPISDVLKVESSVHLNLVVKIRFLAVDLRRNNGYYEIKQKTMFIYLR